MRLYWLMLRSRQPGGGLLLLLLLVVVTSLPGMPTPRAAENSRSKCSLGNQDSNSTLLYTVPC
jgi:hypothetical protein